MNDSIAKFGDQIAGVRSGFESTVSPATTRRRATELHHRPIDANDGW